MEQNLIDLTEFNIPEDELFTVISHDETESEKITAPRYSYWRSVFRVFFQNKINIIILALLGIIVIFSYIYPW